MDDSESLSILPIDSSWPQDGVTSLSTKEIVHARPEQYLAELILVNRDRQLLEIPRFWRLSKYKDSYLGFVMQIVQRLKYCDFKHIHNVIVKHKLTDFKEGADELIVKEIQGI